MYSSRGETSIPSEASPRVGLLVVLTISISAPPQIAGSRTKEDSLRFDVKHVPCPRLYRRHKSREPPGGHRPESDDTTRRTGQMRKSAEFPASLMTDPSAQSAPKPDSIRRSDSPRRHFRDPEFRRRSMPDDRIGWRLVGNPDTGGSRIDRLRAFVCTTRKESRRRSASQWPPPSCNCAAPMQVRRVDPESGDIARVIAAAITSGGHDAVPDHPSSVGSSEAAGDRHGRQPAPAIWWPHRLAASCTGQKEPVRFRERRVECVTHWRRTAAIRMFSVARPPRENSS